MKAGVSVIGVLCIAAIVLLVAGGITALIVVLMRGSSRVDGNLSPCPGCGRMNSAAANFCPQCGKPLGT